MEQKFPHLFSPVDIGGLTMKNRIFSAPTGLASIDHFGHIGPDETDFWALRAAGGAAVVTLGESIIHSPTGLSHARQIQMDSPHVGPGLTKTADAIHRYGAMASLELSHGGSLGAPVPDESGRLVLYGASDDVPGTPGYPVREMPLSLIETLADCFGKAALTAKNAGYDLIMVHAGHGWLLSQFLSPVFNKRRDHFGGSLENRARFLVMALEAVRAYCPGLPIELRMNGSDFMEGGLRLEEAIQVAKLVEDKVDLFHISGGSFIHPLFQTRTHPNCFWGPGPNVELAAAVKAAVKKPVAAVGGLNDPAQCEEILKSGKADVVELARALLADPFFPKKAQSGREKDIVKCLQCMDCSHANLFRNVQSCALNPVIGAERAYFQYNPPAERKKRVLVAGGGPAGMMAAIQAAQRGHQVTLCEKSGRLGGALLPAAIPSFKKRILDFVAVLESRLAEAGVELRLNTAVTPEFARDFAPDVLMAALGADPVCPHIPGWDGEKVLTPEAAEAAPEKLSGPVLIIGGSYLGCETAISLAMKGVKDITVLELREQIMPECGHMWVRPGIQWEFDKYGIRSITGAAALAIDADGVRIQTGGETRLLPAAHVLFCTGSRPRKAEALALSGLAPEFFLLGDCQRAGRIAAAVREGYYAGKYL